MLKYISFFIIFFLISQKNIYSQNANEQKFKIAESYENAGDFKTAGILYNELYLANQNNEIYFNGLVRTLKMQNRYSDLLPTVLRHTENHLSVNNINLLAELYWRTGDFDKANKNWDKAISISPKNELTYKTIAGTQIEVLQYDKAIKTFLSGRDNINNNKLFSDELSQLYIASNNYKLGTQEILNHFFYEKNLPLAQGRLSAVITSSPSKNYVKEILTDLYSNNKKDVMFLRLYYWFLRADSNYIESLKISENIDEILGPNSNEVLNFATNSSVEGQYDIALKALESIIDKGKSNPYFQNALFNFAYILEKRLQLKGKITKTEADEIIIRYKNTASQFPGNQISAECKYRAALIEANQLANYEDAKKDLNEILKSFPKQQPIAAMALQLLGDILFKENKIDSAIEMYKTIVNKNFQYASDEADKAAFKLAQIDFYKGNIDTAKAQFTLLSTKTNSDISSKAIKKMILIETNKSLILGLKQFAVAELYEAQEKYKDAIEKYSDVMKVTNGSDLEEQSTIKIAQIYFYLYNKNNDKNDVISSKDYITKFLEKNPESIYTDAAMLLQGKAYYELKNYTEAEKSLMDLIVKFPRSIYLQESRELIKRIKSIEKL
jgi:tetratricopeptide (TPR) repeat protein